MTTLSPYQLSDLERMLAEQSAGVSPHSDEVDWLVLEAAPALIAMAKRTTEADKMSHDAFKIGLFHQERAEKAEAQAMQYREMAVKLAKVMRDYEENVNCKFRILAEPGIAALLEKQDND